MPLQPSYYVKPPRFYQTERELNENNLSATTREDLSATPRKDLSDTPEEDFYGAPKEELLFRSRKEKQAYHRNKRKADSCRRKKLAEQVHQVTPASASSHRELDHMLECLKLQNQQEEELLAGLAKPVEQNHIFMLGKVSLQEMMCERMTQWQMVGQERLSQQEQEDKDFQQWEAVKLQQQLRLEEERLCNATINVSAAPPTLLKKNTDIHIPTGLDNDPAVLCVINHFPSPESSYSYTSWT